MPTLATYSPWNEISSALDAIKTLCIIDFIYLRKGLDCDPALVHKPLFLDKRRCKVARAFDFNRLVMTSGLPPVLVLNANVFDEEILGHWLDTRKQTFLVRIVELMDNFIGAKSQRL
ncbi:hypothetical protein V8E53_011786 [Lactarius tabidus]